MEAINKSLRLMYSILEIIEQMEAPFFKNDQMRLLQEAKELTKESIEILSKTA